MNPRHRQLRGKGVGDDDHRTAAGAVPPGQTSVLNTVPLYKSIDKYASSMLFLRFDEEKPFLSNIQGKARKLMADKRSVLKPVNLEPSELLILSGVWNPNPKKAVEYPWDGAQEWN